AAANDPDAAPRMIDQGPVLPPISYQPSPDRQAAPTQLASGNRSGSGGATTVTKALTPGDAAALDPRESARATPAAGSGADRSDAAAGATRAEDAVASSTSTSTPTSTSASPSTSGGADAVVAGVRLTATPAGAPSGADAPRLGGGADTANPSVAGPGAGAGSTAVDPTTARGGTAVASGGSPGTATSGGSSGTAASGNAASSGYVPGDASAMPTGLPPIVLDGSGSAGAPSGGSRSDDIAWLPDADASVSPNAQRGPDGVLIGIPDLAVVTPPVLGTGGTGGSGDAGHDSGGGGNSG